MPPLPPMPASLNVSYVNHRDLASPSLSSPSGNMSPPATGGNQLSPGHPGAPNVMATSGAMVGTSLSGPTNGRMPDARDSPPREGARWEGGWGETCARAAVHSAQREASRAAAAAARGDGFPSEHSYGNFGLEDPALIRNLDSLLLDEPDLN